MDCTLKLLGRTGFFVVAQAYRPLVWKVFIEPLGKLRHEISVLVTSDNVVCHFLSF